MEPSPVVTWALCGTAAWSLRWSMGWTPATLAVTPGRKRLYEIVQRLQSAAEATDAPLSSGPAAFLTLRRCGIHCETAPKCVPKCHFPQKCASVIYCGILKTMMTPTELHMTIPPIGPHGPVPQSKLQCSGDNCCICSTFV